METVVALLGRLRQLLARYPLPSFLVLTFALGAVVRYVPWAWLTVFWPGLVALLVCWAASKERALPARCGWRVFVGVGVFALLAVHDLVLGDLSGVGAFYLWPWVGMWLAAGLIWSSVFSPYAEVRALVRLLTVWRLPVRVYLVALLAFPLAGVVTLAVSHLLAHTSSADYQGVRPQLDLGRLVVNSLARVFTATGAVFGWYGFAAARLLRRLSPLVVVLLVVLVQVLLQLVILVSPDASTTYWLITVLTAIADSTLCVWVFVRSNSLIPVLIVQAAGEAAYAVAVHAAYSFSNATYVYLGLQCAMALALVVAGRMWRRPPGAIPAVVSGEAGTAAVTVPSR